MNNIQKAFKTKCALRKMAKGGAVKGPGGPTDDKVGPVMLSDGEYVLPADTVEALGGPEQLDQIREATHTPVKSGLRKMANGGPANGVDELLQPKPSATAAPDPAAKVRLPLDSPERTLSREAQAFKNRTSAAAAEAAPGMAGAGTGAAAGVGGKLGSFVKGVGGKLSNLVKGEVPAGLAAASATAALGGMKGAYDSLTTPAAERERFINSTTTDPNSPLQRVGSDALRVLSNVGNAVTGGWAGKAGEALNDALNGPKQTHFNNSNLSREAKAAAKGYRAPAVKQLPTKVAGNADVKVAKNAAPIKANTYQSNRLTEMGVPVSVQQSAPIAQDSLKNVMGPEAYGQVKDEWRNLGTFGGDANIFGTASSTGGRINKFAGVGKTATGDVKKEDAVLNEITSALRNLSQPSAAPSGNSRLGSATKAAYARYNAAKEQILSHYGPNGMGNASKHLVALDKALAQELTAAAQIDAQRHNTDVQAAAADKNTRLDSLKAVADLYNRTEDRKVNGVKNAMAAQINGVKNAQELDKITFDQLSTAMNKMSGGDPTKEAKLWNMAYSIDPNLTTTLNRLPSSQRGAYIADIFAQLPDIERLNAERNDGGVARAAIGAGAGLMAPGLVGKTAGKAIDGALTLAGKRFGLNYNAGLAEKLLSNPAATASMGGVAGYLSQSERPEVNRIDPIMMDETGKPLPVEVSSSDFTKNSIGDILAASTGLAGGRVRTETGQLVNPDEYSPDSIAALRRLRQIQSQLYGQ